ncbi:low temperature requirement protein A [Terrarubrum flagellatum]|uniref:low temperature requirement protein A n=1 Tax=Terrirubrum flagellatum TaxID=2895980 RepID=UPI0031453BA4
MTTDRSISLLRGETVHGHHRVTFVELFFDLVFVFAVTQVSHTLLAHFTLIGAIETLMLLLGVWWAWIFTSWTTNWFDPERTPVRIALFALMIAGLVLSTSIPKAFESRGLAFALAYAAIQVGRTLFFLLSLPPSELAQRRNFQRILAWLSTAAVFWIAGGFAEGGARIALWAIALAIEYAAPAARFWTPVIGASSIADWTIEGGHMAERCALFVIIALGESLLVTGATFADRTWDAPVVAAFALAFIGSVAMWWIYFDSGAEEGSEQMSKAMDSGRIARLAYTYMHLPIVAGIIVSAAADELALAHPVGHVEGKFALSAIGGPLLFLVGMILFKRAVRGWFMLSHMVGIAALLLLIPFAAQMTPLIFYGLTSFILVVVAAWETISLANRED